MESFFAGPAPRVGAAVRGPLETLIRPEQPDAASQDAIFANLVSSGQDYTPAQKVALYLKLLPERRTEYLQTLTPSRRDAFLDLLGEQGVRFPMDLKAEKIDRNLRQFGYDFFAAGAQQEASGYVGPIGPDYILGPNDELHLSIWGPFSADYRLEIDRNGDLTIPKIGTVHLWGLPLEEARAAIGRQVSRYYKNFEFNVSLGSLRSIQVYVVGEVDDPGMYTLSSVSSVLNALVAAGGPNKTGSLREIQLLRRGELVARIDFYDFLLEGNRGRDLRLLAGDTVFVPVVGPLVGIAGDVRRPAIFEIEPGETLQDLMDMAGGVVATAYLKKVQLERVEAHQRKTIIDIDLSAVADNSADMIPLQDRDLVLISPIAPFKADYVMLEGYVAHPGRYQLLAGQRLADLLLQHDNLLPDYYPEMAEILRLEPPDYSPRKLTVDLRRALQGNQTHNLELQKFDEIRLFSRQEMQETPQISVTGAVLKPGNHRYFTAMTVRDAILSSGNLKASAYLGEAELTRFKPVGRGTETSRVTFDLEKALAGDPDHNLILEPEDHLFIRAIPDYAEQRLVRLTGEVLFPGTYSIARGETLSSVLERAGGYAEGAYLRGGVFSRQSIKEKQRERLEKLISEQEQQISRVSSDIALGALSSEELQSAQAILESRQALLEKLKAAPASGRMVLKLAPLADFKGSEFDVDLLDGDHLHIPQNPKAVSVLGQVYNPVSITYQPGQTVAYYLGKVGGTTENADSDNLFIVRADGTVFSKAQAGMGVRWDSANNRWVAGGFMGTELYPGDTVLAPEKIRRYDFMREFKDITTIIYQMALGAAAVASF